jgi:hypothetical protein
MLGASNTSRRDWAMENLCGMRSGTSKAMLVRGQRVLYDVAQLKWGLRFALPATICTWTGT